MGAEKGWLTMQERLILKIESREEDLRRFTRWLSQALGAGISIFIFCLSVLKDSPGGYKVPITTNYS